MAKGAPSVSPLEAFGKLSPANKALVALLVMALAGVAFYVMFYQDVDGNIAKAKGQKQKLEKTLTDYQVKLRDKQQFQEEIRQLEKKRRTALEKLPETADIPALLSKIHGQAKIVGLEIKDFEPGLLLDDPGADEPGGHLSADRDVLLLRREAHPDRQPQQHRAHR